MDLVIASVKSEMMISSNTVCRTQQNSNRNTSSCSLRLLLDFIRTASYSLDGCDWCESSVWSSKAVVYYSVPSVWQNEVIPHICNGVHISDEFNSWKSLLLTHLLNCSQYLWHASWSCGPWILVEIWTVYHDDEEPKQPNAIVSVISSFTWYRQLPKDFLRQGYIK